MLNSLEFAIKFLGEAKLILDRNLPNQDSKYHGILYRVYGYIYWRSFKKLKSEEYLNKALEVFEKLKDPYLISTIHKEKGDLHKETFNMELA
jgi:hypothetical protein